MKSDADDKWMTDELWEKRRGGVVRLTRWVLVCSVRAADALRSEATGTPPAAQHQSPVTVSLSHVHSS